MDAFAGDRANTVILLLPEVKQAYPLSNLAFTQAQGSKRKITRSYLKAYIVDAEGRFRKFEEVQVLGPIGSSFGRRAFSYLRGAWRIRVELSTPLEYSLEDAKRLLIDCMDTPLSADNFDFESLDAHKKFIESIRSATSIGTLLNDLVLSAPENSLDVL
ncbi:MAG: hypothetical protein O9253_02520 [Aquidulcibacter sp.]|jgi:hypothetical protein|nr:hypothetical protein [Aquidulcibacter sp.]